MCMTFVAVKFVIRYGLKYIFWPSPKCIKFYFTFLYPRTLMFTMSFGIYNSVQMAFFSSKQKMSSLLWPRIRNCHSSLTFYKRRVNFKNGEQLTEEICGAPDANLDLWWLRRAAWTSCPGSLESSRRVCCTCKCRRVSEPKVEIYF